MWNMQLCMAHLLVVADFRYLQYSASGGAKSSFSTQKWLYFPSRLLSFKDSRHWRPPKDSPWKAAYIIYQALNYLINNGRLNWGNRLVKTGAKPAGSGFSWICYTRNCPKLEPLLTLERDDIALCAVMMVELRTTKGWGKKMGMIWMIQSDMRNQRYNLLNWVSKILYHCHYILNQKSHLLYWQC